MAPAAPPTAAATTTTLALAAAVLLAWGARHDCGRDDVEAAAAKAPSVNASERAGPPKPELSQIIALVALSVLASLDAAVEAAAAAEGSVARADEPPARIGMML